MLHVTNHDDRGSVFYGCRVLGGVGSDLVTQFCGGEVCKGLRGILMSTFARYSITSFCVYSS